MKTIRIFFAILFMAAISKTASAQNIPDNELKKNVSPITNSLSYISRLQPQVFEYNKERFKAFKLPAGIQYGFIAEEMREVLPAAVSRESKFFPAGKNNFGVATINRTENEDLIPILVGAIKEQQEQIENLKKEVEKLKAR